MEGLLLSTSLLRSLGGTLGGETDDISSDSGKSIAIPATLTDSGESTPAAISEHRSKVFLNLQFNSDFFKFKKQRNKGRIRRRRRQRLLSVFCFLRLFLLCVFLKCVLFLCFAFWFWALRVEERGRRECVSCLCVEIFTYPVRFSPRQHSPPNGTLMYTFLDYHYPFLYLI